MSGDAPASVVVSCGYELSLAPGVPRYAERTARPRLVHVRSTTVVPAWGKLPYAFGTCGTQEASTCSTEAPGRTCQPSLGLSAASCSSVAGLDMTV